MKKLENRRKTTLAAIVEDSEQMDRWIKSIRHQTEDDFFDGEPGHVFKTGWGRPKPAMIASKEEALSALKRNAVCLDDIPEEFGSKELYHNGREPIRQRDQARPDEAQDGGTLPHGHVQMRRRACVRSRKPENARAVSCRRKAARHRAWSRPGKTHDRGTLSFGDKGRSLRASVYAGKADNREDVRRGRESLLPFA